ncbi:hypothetical protein Tco_1149781, partial [Tanacetum coccineum]
KKKMLWHQNSGAKPLPLNSGAKLHFADVAPLLEFDTTTPCALRCTSSHVLSFRALQDREAIITSDPFAQTKVSSSLDFSQIQTGFWSVVLALELKSASALASALVLALAEEAHCDLWVMEHDSFKKLFTIGTSFYTLLGFSKRGEPIYEVGKSDGELATFDVYDFCAQRIKNLGIIGVGMDIDVVWKPYMDLSSYNFHFP